MGTVNLAKQTVNLSKRQVVNLSKHSEGLKEVLIGLGWSDASSAGETITQVVQPGFLGKLLGAKPREVTRTIKSTYEYDLDAWVGFINGSEIHSLQDVCYFGNKDMFSTKGRFIHHCGDDLTGGGDVNADNEQIFIDLDKIPDKYNGAVIGVTIYRGKERGQSFKNIRNMFVRVVDTKDGFEMCRYNDSIASEYDDCITFFVGKLFKTAGEWQFEALGDGSRCSSIPEAVRNYTDRA